MAGTGLINVNYKPREAIECQDDVYQEIGTRAADNYFTFFVHVVLSVPLIEATDQEMLQLLQHSGAFAVWEQEGEDIYTLEDGSPL